MSDKIAIKYNGNVYYYDKNTTFYEISKNFKSEFQYEIVGALVDNEVAELSDKLMRPCYISFFDLKSDIGCKIYERGLVFLYMYAVKMVLGEDTLIEIDHSIDKGIYTSVNKTITEYVLIEIDRVMKKLVEENVEFKKNTILRKEAVKYFANTKRNDKAKMLRYISNSYITLYKFKNMFDYFYGEMPHSSSTLKYFKLSMVEDRGIVISYPSIYSESTEIEYKHHSALFTAFQEYGEYQDKIGVKNISDLNEQVSNSTIGNLIRIDETFQNQRLLEVVKEIYSKKDVIKLVLIAGPSSSGKTTASKKMSIFLEGLGLIPHAVSLDDFIKERFETPRDAGGNYDYESIDAIDVKLFNDTLEKLFKGEEVLMPTYNFMNGKKEFKDKLKINGNDILVIEGLHGLNEELTSKIPRENKYKVYLGPLTNLNIDYCNRIHTTDTRLIRRMIRDNNTRGYNASETIRMWKDVRKGEEKYVFPYQDNADCIFNTAFVYELGVLKTYVEPLLYAVDVNDPGYSEALRLINFLRNFLPIAADDVPTDSLLREFIGNSCFKK